LSRGEDHICKKSANRLNDGYGRVCGFSPGYLSGNCWGVNQVKSILRKTMGTQSPRISRTGGNGSLQERVANLIGIAKG